MLLDIGEPGPYVCLERLDLFNNLVDSSVTVEALLVRHIIHQQDSHCSSVICSCYGPEALLPSGIPYLEFHSLAI